MIGFFIFVTVALASPLKSWDSVLSLPLDVRVKEFNSLPNQSYPFLSKISKDKSASIQTRWRALTTMGRANAKYFRKDIEGALKSRDWFLRNAALIALQGDDREFAVTWSTKLLRDTALMVRTQAVRNLVTLDAREVEPILWKEIGSKINFNGHQSLWIRAYIAEALVLLSPPGPSRSKHFERLLLDGDERLHLWAIRGLEQATGLKISDNQEDVEVRRQKWLSRLGIQAI